jgi:hypothetical protein
MRRRENVTLRQLLRSMNQGGTAPKEFSQVMLPDGRLISRKDADTDANKDYRLLRTNAAVSPEDSNTVTCEVEFMDGKKLFCGAGRHWKTGKVGFSRLEKANRIDFSQGVTRLYRRFLQDREYAQVPNVWTDTRSEQNQIDVVQTQD